MTNILNQKIKQTTFIALPPEKVYDTITSASEWDRFFTTGMELDPKPGGKIIFRWKDWGPDFYSTEVDGRVREAVRPTRFAFEWGTEMPTLVTFELTAQHGGTVVRLTESGYPDTPKGRDMILECASGWGEALTLLKFFLEHGITYTSPGKGE
jgi:uncharacterized protein YndB with AHSA1/START domain